MQTVHATLTEQLGSEPVKQHQRVISKRLQQAWQRHALDSIVRKSVAPEPNGRSASKEDNDEKTELVRAYTASMGSFASMYIPAPIRKRRTKLAKASARRRRSPAVDTDADATDTDVGATSDRGSSPMGRSSSTSLRSVAAPRSATTQVLSYVPKMKEEVITTVSASIALVGHSGCGKSALVTRVVTGMFTSECQPTMGASILMHEHTFAAPQDLGLAKAAVKFQLRDTSGNLRYRSLAEMYLRDAMVILVVFDVESKESFDTAISWVEEHKGAWTSTLVLLVGNKIDTIRFAVTNEEAQSYAQVNGLTFRGVSACTGNGVEDLFDNVGGRLLWGGNLNFNCRIAHELFCRSELQQQR